MSIDGPFFKTGFSSDGGLHATLVYWGSGLCSEPLQFVDDRRHYTASELEQINLCRDCSAVAATANGPGNDEVLVEDSRTLPA